MDGQTQSEEVEMGHQLSEAVEISLPPPPPPTTARGHHLEQSWEVVEEGEEEVVGEARSGVDETFNTSTDHDAQRFSVVSARRANDQKGRWTKPSIDKALEYRCTSRPWHEDSGEMPYKPHPLSSSFIADGKLGEGLALWMQFLKSTSLLFFVLFLINLPAFIFYLHGTGLSDEHGRPASGNAILALPSLGNLFGKADLSINLDPSNESKTFTLYMFGKDVTLSRNLISILLPALDLLGILILLIFVVRLRYVQHAKKADKDKKAKTAADYTVMVTGIYGNGMNLGAQHPHTICFLILNILHISRCAAPSYYCTCVLIRYILLESLQEYFEKYGKVEVVSVAIHTEVFLTFKRTDAEISEKIAIIEAKVARAQQLAREGKKKPPLFWVRDAEQGGCSEGGDILASRSGAHMQTVFEFERSIKALDKLREKFKSSAESKDVHAAFITFALPDGKTNVLSLLALLVQKYKY